LKNRSENSAGRGQILPILQVNSCSIDQKSGEICTGQANLQPISFKSDRLLEQAPLLYAEVISSVRRALLPRFPYGLFYAVRGDLVHVLAVLHDARNPSRWPKSR
jgi:hypothetical protein